MAESRCGRCGDPLTREEAAEHVRVCGPCIAAHTLVVNMRTRGAVWDVRIDRGTPWGNPFVIGPDGDREAVLQRYALWLPAQPELMAALDRLRGKRLGCWCAPLPCHGHILARLANVELPGAPPA